MTSPAPLGDILAYLSEIGYGDFYLRPPAPGLRPAARPEQVRVAQTPPEAAPELTVPPPPPAIEPVPVLQRAVEPGPEPGIRLADLKSLADLVATCSRCRLAEGRKSVVFGAGNADADLMLIGEGPGAEEDRQGLPFVGPAGELLTRIIQAMEMKRDDVYIANVVKCRPPGNRDPQPDEVQACRGYLEKQVALVRPRVLVALGRVAAQALLGNESPIGQLRGRWYQAFGVPTMVTYHPAALLRNPALKRPTWEDMQQVRDRLR
jgi:uracil-DNA glycosylase family 4